MPGFRGISAEQRRDDRRGRLVEAAYELVGTRGAAHLGVGDVCAAAGLMVTSGKAAKKAFTTIDWTLLAFFGGLFVVVAGVAHAGVLDRVFDAVAPIIGRGDLWGDSAGGPEHRVQEVVDG